MRQVEAGVWKEWMMQADRHSTLDNSAYELRLMCRTTGIIGDSIDHKLSDIQEEQR